MTILIFIKREIIRQDEVPRSRIPEPAPKRRRSSRSTSKVPVPGSSRSDESRAEATRLVGASGEDLVAVGPGTLEVDRLLLGRFCQYKDIPVWSVTVGRPEDPLSQRSRKLTLKDLRLTQRSRNLSLKDPL